MLVKDDQGRWQVRCAASCGIQGRALCCGNCGRWGRGCTLSCRFRWSQAARAQRCVRLPTPSPHLQLVKLRKLDANSKHLLLSRVYRQTEDEGLGFFARVRERLDRCGLGSWAVLCCGLGSSAVLLGGRWQARLVRQLQVGSVAGRPSDDVCCSPQCCRLVLCMPQPLLLPSPLLAAAAARCAGPTCPRLLLRSASRTSACAAARSSKQRSRACWASSRWVLAGQ